MLVILSIKGGLYDNWQELVNWSFRMWALPRLSDLDTEHLPDRLDDRRIWCLLLFPRAEVWILEGLRRNWERFSNALGDNVHVITLLDSGAPKSGKDLRFPANYEAQVGRFCHDLHIRLDELPAVFLLNASDGRGAPYFSIRRDSAQQSAAVLETLVSDICSASYDVSDDLNASDWRTAVATKLLNKRSTREALGFLRAHRSELISMIQQLIRAVLGHPPLDAR